MTLMIASEVFITCAVTGSADSVGKNPQCARDARRRSPRPRSMRMRPAPPSCICMSAIQIPAQASRDPALFREVVERIRQKNSEVILNLTGGMGGDLCSDRSKRRSVSAAGTDFVGPHERITHVLELLPEIGSLDCGSLNFDELLYGTTPGYLRSMARAYQQKNIRPELEVFELGHIELAKQLLAEGLIDQPALFQLCLGIKYGAPANSEAMQAMRDALPPGSHWSAFGLGRMQMPMVAQAVLLGRQCARGARGQSLSRAGSARDQFQAGRTGPRDHRALGRACSDRGANPRAARLRYPAGHLTPA